MKLYYTPGACSLSPHIALYESGLEFEAIKVEHGTGLLPDGKKFKEVNSLGYVPLLELDDGGQLIEGPAIVQYISDLVPDKQLAPANGTFARYQLQSWLNFISTELHKGFSSIFSTINPDEIKDKWRVSLKNRFSWVDENLSRHPYLMGDAYTVADAYLLTVSNWSNLANLDIKDLDHLQSFRRRILSRSAVHSAMKAEGLIM